MTTSSSVSTKGTTKRPLPYSVRSSKSNNTTLTPVIPTTSGPIQGFINNNKDDVWTFLGIPYARPPLGPLRWHPPQPPEISPSTIKATKYSRAAIQNPMQFDTLMRSEIFATSEDCLYLNVWTPKYACNDEAPIDPSQKVPLPVIIWIHPGACMSGSGSAKFWDGSNIAKRGVVYFTFNYRLGVLGWMNLQDVCGSEWEGTGNLGLLDIIQAMKWVKDNAFRFGGDPDRITVMGASSGAACIAALLTTSASKGLFHRAILQSPPMFICSPRDWARYKSETFLRTLGLNASAAEELRELHSDRLLDVQMHAFQWPNFIEGLAPIGLVEDGNILQTTIIQRLCQGPVVENVDILWGWTRDEFNFFLPLTPDFDNRDRDTAIRTFFTHIFGNKGANRAYEIYESFSSVTRPADLSATLASDVIVRIASIYAAENMSKGGNSIYTYQWNYESTGFNGVLKASHMIDLAFSLDNFETWKENPLLGPGDNVERQRLTEQLTDSFVAFATTGNPNHEKLGVSWPKYEVPESEGGQPGYESIKRATMVFEKVPNVQDDVYKEGRIAWQSQLEEMVTTPVFQIARKKGT